LDVRRALAPELTEKQLGIDNAAVCACRQIGEPLASGRLQFPYLIDSAKNATL
jgi:hypothetical protein